ncbi:Uncharacterised protein [uncultured Comamonas sp.]|nr:Uncharacterised protein [uncultured Comamonas sp.]
MRIESVEDAIELLRVIHEDGVQFSEEDVEAFDIGGELAKIFIKITGENYHGTVPGELARGLWEYQQELYRAGAFVLTGALDYRRLSPEQRQSLELVFKIAEGSTNAEAETQGYWAVLKHALQGMTGTQKVVTMTLVGLILAGALTVYGVHGQMTQVALAKENTAQMDVVRKAAEGNKIAKTVEESNDRGITSVIKGAADAESVTVNRAHYDREAIEEITRRTERTQSSAEVLSEPFRVFSIEAKDHARTKCVLAAPDGREFSVTIDHDDFLPDDVAKIWAAARDRATITLEVHIKTLKGNIRRAQILSVE